MNIFVLDESPVLAARCQHDRHVVKMILESAQMLSAACQLESAGSIPLHYADVCKTFPGDSTLYKLTHQNHPATQWVSSSPVNFVWLTIHMDALMCEYRARFNRAHKCQRLLYLFAAISGRIVGHGFYTTKNSIYVSATQFVQSTVNRAVYDFATQYRKPFVYCGPDSYFASGLGSIDAVVVESYRRYYVGEKVQGNRWTRHAGLELPEWLEAANPTRVQPKWLRESKPKPKRLFALPKPDLTKLANPSAVRLGNLKFSRFGDTKAEHYETLNRLATDAKNS